MIRIYWYHHHHQGYKHVFYHLPKFPPVSFFYNYYFVARGFNISSIFFVSYKYIIQCSVIGFISRSFFGFYSNLLSLFLFTFIDSLDITEQENVKYPGTHTLGPLAPYLLGEAHRTKSPCICAHLPFLLVVLPDMLRDPVWRVVGHQEEKFESRAVKCLSCKIPLLT